MAEAIVNRLLKLLCVKSIMTIMLTVVFAVMTLRGVITPDYFMDVFKLIVTFYFVTQAQKKADA